MKKFLVVILVLSVVLSMALVPGMKKRMYGGAVSALLLPGVFGMGFDGYYKEGMDLYKIEGANIEIDGYAGVGVYTSYIATIGVAGLGYGIRFIGTLIAYKEDFGFDVMGYRVTPALGLDIAVYYTFAGVSGMGFGYLSDAGLGTSATLYPTLFVNWGKGKYVNFFFWPFPLTFGVNVVEF